MVILNFFILLILQNAQIYINQGITTIIAVLYIYISFYIYNFFPVVQPIRQLRTMEPDFHNNMASLSDDMHLDWLKILASENIKRIDEAVSILTVVHL